MSRGGVTENEDTGRLAAAGPWVAMAAAVILTAKGEFDLAVLSHFAPEIAWMFPVMIDVYVLVAFHRRKWRDMLIGMLLMIFAQIAVHLLPVYITAGEQTPWGLVVAVACIAPVVVVRVKILTGQTAPEIAAEQEAARRADEVRAARAETVGLRRELSEITARAEAARVEIEQRLQAETARAEAEIAARAEAEIAAEQALRQVEISGRERADAEGALRAEIDRVRDAAARAIDACQVAEDSAIRQRELARLAEGRLAEAREAADRAGQARAVAEQRAAAHVEQVTTAARSAEQGLQEQLAAVTQAAEQAEHQATKLAEQVRVVQAQLEEARAASERQSTARVIAEQQLAELQKGRDAAINEVEKLRRQLARAQERAEISGPRQAEISRPVRAEISGPGRAETHRGAGRKSLAVVPADLPDVDSVRPETVAVVLAARAENPGATQAELAATTGISARTIRKVINAVPVAGEVIALTDGRVA